MSFMDKAKDMAGEHPDQARQGIDKVEDAVDAKTGGKFAGQVDKGGDMAEKGLGLGQAPQGDVPPADQPPA